MSEGRYLVEITHDPRENFLFRYHITVTDTVSKERKSDFAMSRKRALKVATWLRDDIERNQRKPKPTTTSYHLD